MYFLTRGKTNWKYILIVIILAVIVGGGILVWQKMLEVPPSELPEIKKPEKVEKPYIKVISPNGGGQWIVGKTYDISWESQKVNKVYIYLVKEEESDVTEIIVNSYQASLGKYSWTIPSNNNDINLGGQFKIVISSIEEKNIRDESDNYFNILKDETTKCSPVDFAGYELVKNYKFNVDLNNDGEKEIVRVYWDSSKEECGKVKPIMVKVFSGAENCPKEVFSYGWGNQVGKAEIFQNFWGDGSNVVLVEGMSYACGCGSTIRLLFLTYREGKYSIVEGPQLGGLRHLYKFTGENGLGKKIIVAEERWADDYSDYCCGCKSRLQFMIYTWDGEVYTKTVAGITQNKYLSESIDEILQKEPSVLNQQ